MTSTRSYRKRAFLLACDAGGAAREELLALHPKAGSLRALEVDAADVRALLFEELEELERRTPAVFRLDVPLETHSAPSYFRRRSVVEKGRLWREAQRRLPAVWIRRLELPPHHVTRLTVDIGLEVLATCARDVSITTLPEFLRPLGGKLIRRVVRRLKDAELARLSIALRRELSSIWSDVSSAQRGERAAALLGTRFLATSFRRLGAADRCLAARIGVSSLPRLLEATEPIAAADPAEVDELERSLASRAEREIESDDRS